MGRAITGLSRRASPIHGACARLDDRLGALASRFRLDPANIAGTLKPALDAMACHALSAGAGDGLHPTWRAPLPTAADLLDVAHLLRPHVADAQFLPVLASLGYRCGVFDVKRVRSIARHLDFGSILPLGTDLLVALTVEVPKLDIGIASAAREVFFGSYFRKHFISPPRFATGDLASGYLLTHLVFFASGFGHRTEKLAGFSALHHCLENVGWLAFQQGHCDLLAEVVISLALLSNRDAIASEWLDALAGNVSDAGWAFDSRYPIADPGTAQDEALFASCYHCTLVTRLALGLTDGPLPCP